MQYRNFYCLRHTFATHTIAGGVDAKTLSGILGHENASFTLDTYTLPPICRKARRGSWVILWMKLSEVLSMGKRRKHGDGTSRLRKDGRWEGRVVVGYDEKGLSITKNVTAKAKDECTGISRREYPYLVCFIEYLKIFPLLFLAPFQRLFLRRTRQNHYQPDVRIVLFQFQNRSRRE